MIFFEIEGSRPANSSPETLMLLLLLLRLSSQANRNERRVEEGGPEGAVIFFEIPANWSGITDGQVPNPSRRTEAGPAWCLIMMPIWLSRIHKQASSSSSCHW